MSCTASHLLLVFLSAALLLARSADCAEPATTGPETEQRFPPLKLPAGFQATLFACDPLIEYPSAIALGPRAGTLFVAVDYMTGLGTGLERRSEVRLLEDSDGDGYADKASVFAAGFNSIQGLTWHAETLYAMHAPHLTAVRDTTGDGQADDRRDLVTGLGLPPEQDTIRLHNANGVVAGHDGWLYLALGDRGCDVRRPEGDRLVLAGGGILRCRPDGRDLHVFATGLRNIYDVALDEELNVFVRDNENDGGDYKIRVCHSFFGADHGYPYLYYERPAEALAPLADLGLGSSAGGVAYLESQFPADYRGGLLFCEWGRAVVQYPLRRAGASFGTQQEIDLAAGGDSDPYGFKPTDLIVARDGSLFVSDWCDGQRPRRGRGRIYQIRYAAGAEEASNAAALQGLAALDSESYHGRTSAQAAIEATGKAGREEIEAALAENRLGVRGRLHAVWVLARDEPQVAIERLLELARSDADPRVQAQAIRAVADLADPVLTKHCLDAGRGDGGLAIRLAQFAAGRDPRVVLETIIALGRLRWSEAPEWLDQEVVRTDPAAAHTALWALRRSDNWPAVLKLIDRQPSDPLRHIALRAVADQSDAALVDGLIERLAKESDAGRRSELADLLTRVHHQPAAWTYWGFRPPPRPAGTLAWERTDAIQASLNQALVDSDLPTRGELLRRMVREKIPVRTQPLGRWLVEERDAARTGAILHALRDRPADEVRALLEGVIRERGHTSQNRLAATATWAAGLEPGDDRPAKIAADIGDGPVLAELLQVIGSRKATGAANLVIAKLSSADALVRISALETAARLDLREAGRSIRESLSDADPHVRAAAALAAGRLGHRPAADDLLKLASDSDASVRRASLVALRLLGEPRAVPLAVVALSDDETTLPALEFLCDFGGVEHASAIAEAARRNPAVEVLAAATKVLTGWAAKDDLPADEQQQIQQALADIHGGSGALLAWTVWGPLAHPAAEELVAVLAAGNRPAAAGQVVLSAGQESSVPLAAGEGVCLAICELAFAEETPVVFFAGSSGLETVWLNGKTVHERKQPLASGSLPDQFNATLPKGTSRVVVRLSDWPSGEKARFQLGFRRQTASSDHERLTAAALARPGNLDRGKKVLLNAEKSLCLKCHRLGDQGERVGPELTGLGGRFSKIHIVESILQPSRSISTSFQATLVALVDGRRLTGIQLAETDADVTIVDSEGRKQTIPRAEIEAARKATLSAMPEGLERKLTEDEFVDLIAFLTSLRQGNVPTEPGRP